jgi:two-component system, OmpR family, sensor kinase
MKRVLRSPWRRFKRLPVRWRLTIASASLTFVILLVFGGAVGKLVSERIRSDFNHEVQQSATRLVSRTRIVEKPFSEPVVVSPDLGDVSLPNDAFARVVNTEGQILDQAPEDVPELGPPRVGVHTDGSLTVATQGVLGPNSQVVGYIQYARSNRGVAATITRLWLFIAAGVLGGTILAVLAGLALASRAMQPISSLTATAREVANTRDPSRRLPEPTTDDEVGELNVTLQQMLAELEASQADRDAAMEKQRAFVADASHELRTPLTSVLANLELLQLQYEKSGGKEEREIVNSALGSSKRMSRLVSDLLVLARSDAQQSRPMRGCDLGEVAVGAARELSPRLGERELDVTGCGAAPVVGNRDDLHRLVVNLLDNAIRYSPEDAEIRLATGVDPSTRSAFLVVEDSGPGIAPGMRERVFERFVRNQDGSDTSPTDGTGLGLAMVKAIAEDHRGAVAAEASTLGGARLRLTLPAAAQERADPDHAGARKSPRAQA